MFAYFMEALRKYAVFSGRSRRAEFWYFTLVTFLIALAAGILGGVLAGVTGGTAVNGAVSPVAFLPDIVMLALLIPQLAVTVRRLHDTGRSGWWYFLALVPLVGTIVLIIWYCEDSQAGANRYGPNPKEAVSVV